MAFPDRSGAWAAPVTHAPRERGRAQANAVGRVAYARGRPRSRDLAGRCLRFRRLARLELVLVQFLNGLQPQLDLTYDDVFMVPSRSSVTSRLDVDLSTVDGSGTTIPLVVANMTAIAGRRMAETVARRGGIAVIPQDIPVAVVRDVVGWVKQRHLVHDTAITLERHMTAGEALVLIGKRAHGAAVVVDGPKPVGIVTEKDLTGVDRYTQVHDVMHEDMVVLPDSVDPQEAFGRLSAARL